MTAATEKLLDRVIEMAQDALRSARLADGESRLHWLVQAKVHVEEAIAFAKLPDGQTTGGDA